MTNLLTPTEVAIKVLKRNFSLVEQKKIEHFPCLIGEILRFVINYQGKKITFFLAQTNNDIIVRLFDTDSPEKYFKGEKWVKNSGERSNRPYILNWKCLYDSPKEKQWLDLQLPLHSLPKEIIHIVFKMVEVCQEISLKLEKN